MTPDLGNDTMSTVDRVHRLMCRWQLLEYRALHERWVLLGQGKKGLPPPSYPFPHVLPGMRSAFEANLLVEDTPQ